MLNNIVQFAQVAFLVFATALLAVLITRGNLYPRGLLVQTGLLLIVVVIAIALGEKAWIGPPIGAIIAIVVLMLIRRRAHRRQQESGGTEDGGVNDLG